MAGMNIALKKQKSTNTRIKYRFGGWLIEWDEPTQGVFLGIGPHSCSLACAEAEGVASCGNSEYPVPDEVLAMAQELEEAHLLD